MIAEEACVMVDEEREPERRGGSVERQEVDLVELFVLLEEVKPPPCVAAQPHWHAQASDRFDADRPARRVFPVHSCRDGIVLDARVAVPLGQHAVDRLAVDRELRHLVRGVLEHHRVPCNRRERVHDPAWTGARSEEIAEVVPDLLRLTKERVLLADDRCVHLLRDLDEGCLVTQRDERQRPGRSFFDDALGNLVDRAAELDNDTGDARVREPMEVLALLPLVARHAEPGCDEQLAPL